jgi:hypothetical protein
MSNLEHRIESDGYLYEATPLQDNPIGLNLGVLEFYAHFVNAFEEAQASWQKRVREGDLKYVDGYRLYSMVLDMDGMPSTLIANVDDIVQAFNIRMLGKVEEEQK